jgi:hypothetical protein
MASGSVADRVLNAATAGALVPGDLAALNALLQQVLTGIERRFPAQPPADGAEAAGRPGSR